MYTKKIGQVSGPAVRDPGSNHIITGRVGSLTGPWERKEVGRGKRWSFLGKEGRVGQSR